MPKMVSPDRPYAIYCRLSRATNGDTENVEWQEKECRRHAEIYRLPVSDDHVYVDNSFSAWKGIRRPGWDAMMEAARNHAVGGIIVLALDRFTRRPMDLEQLILLAEPGSRHNKNGHPMIIESVRGGHFDLNEAEGRFRARSMGNQASMESDNTSARVRAAFGRMIMDGKTTGGQSGFGFKGHDQVPEEVAVLREVGRRLLAGEPLAHLAHWLNQEGWQTGRGAEWTGPKLGRALGNKRYGGWLEHNGEVVGRIKCSDGTEQDPVFDQETYDSVQALLTARRRGRRPTGGWWLTGAVICSDCQLPMSGAHLYNKPGGKLRVYQCHRGNGGCQRMITADRLEGEVERHMINFMRDPRHAAKVARNMSKLNSERVRQQADLDRIDGMIVDLEVKLATGGTTQRAYDAAMPKLMSTRTKLLEGLAALEPDQVAGTVDLAAGWTSAAAGPDERKAILRYFRTKIEVRRPRVAGERGNQVDISHAVV